VTNGVNLMAASKQDIILRDRLQFTLDGNGDLATQYGRIELDDYINVAKRQGVKVKEIHFQLLDVTNGPAAPGLSVANTGVWVPLGVENATPTDFDQFSAMKIYATTTAYQNASDVGIGSPDVIAIREEWLATYGVSDAAGISMHVNSNMESYGVTDLHPAGYPVVSDILIGCAADGWDSYADATISLDVMLVCEPATFTVSDFTDILAQQQDI